MYEYLESKAVMWSIYCIHKGKKRQLSMTIQDLTLELLARGEKSKGSQTFSLTISNSLIGNKRVAGWPSG